MRCSCGSEGTITVARRAMPYCQQCFLHLLAHKARLEAGNEPVPLQHTDGYYGRAVLAILTLAQREWCTSPTGFVPGCQNTQAQAVIEYVFGDTPNLIQHFPASITGEELQRFMSEARPEQERETELERLDTQHPGTIASIAKYAREQRERSSPHKTR